MSVEVRPSDAQFYINRLVKLCELRQSIDSGNYPLRNYSSGEVERVKYYTDYSGHRIEEKVYAELPIHPYKWQKGLRFGVLFGIFGTHKMLAEMGLGKEATEIVDFDRTMPGGRKLLRDGKRT